MADAAGCRVDEDALPGLDVGGVDEGLVGGQGGERQSAGLDVVDAGGLVDEGAGGAGHVLGVGADTVGVGQHAEDLVARLEQGDAGADGLDDAGDVPAQDEGQHAGGHGLGTVPPVGRVEPAARTAIRISLNPGSGRGTSTSLSTSGEPWVSWRMARMVAVSEFVMRPASRPATRGTMA